MKVLSWFALQVRTRTENQVESILQNKSYETFLPTYTECHCYSDRIRKVRAPLFPGYLFCRFDSRRRLDLLTTPSVLQIVSFGDGPAPVDSSEIEALRFVVKAGGDVHPWPGLAVGDRVIVEYGAFAGVEGKLVKTKGSDHLILSLSLLQRSASVEIDRTWVRPVDEARSLRLAVV
jgi:transcription termination/antitermination protein NusG